MDLCFFLCYSKCKDNCRFAHGRVPKGVFIQRKNNDSQGEKKEREDSPTVALHNWKLWSFLIIGKESSLSI